MSMSSVNPVIIAYALNVLSLQLSIFKVTGVERNEIALKIFVVTLPIQSRCFNWFWCWVIGLCKHLFDTINKAGV